MRVREEDKLPVKEWKMLRFEKWSIDCMILAFQSEGKVGGR